MKKTRKRIHRRQHKKTRRGGMMGQLNKFPEKYPPPEEVPKEKRSWFKRLLGIKPKTEEQKLEEDNKRRDALRKKYQFVAL